MANFLNKQQAEAIIRSKFPNSRNIEFVEHGYNNLIAKIDAQYVMRFPKNDEGKARFEFGVNVLQRLAQNLGVPVPTVIEVSYHPQYSISSYLPGTHLENKDIRALGSQTLSDIGEQLAKFSIGLNKVFSPLEIKSLRGKTGLDKVSPAWDVYFEDIFNKPQENPDIEALNRKYYSLWKGVVEASSKEIVIHDDLHAANLLFDNNRLSGVLDFEDINTGTIEQEFCDLFRLSEDVLLAAAQKYLELTGHKVNIEAVKTWAITAELAAYSRQINKNDLDHPSFKRAQAKLRFWLGRDFPF